MLDQARDAATQQTAAGYPLVKTIDTSFSFTREEVSVLRALAWQVAEISQRPVMAEKARLWTAHNDPADAAATCFYRPGKWMERDDSRTYAALQRPVGARVGDGAA